MEPAITIREPDILLSIPDSMSNDTIPVSIPSPTKLSPRQDVQSAKNVDKANSPVKPQVPTINENLVLRSGRVTKPPNYLKDFLLSK